MDRNRDDQMIYLKDLLFATLYRWKTVLAAAVVLALLLGAVQGIRSLGAAASTSGTNGNAISQAETDLYQQRRATLEQKIALTQQSVDAQQLYMDNSLLMQLDPGAYYETVVTLYIRTDYQILPGMTYQNPDQTDAVLNAYAAIVTGNDCAKALADALGSQAPYIAEVLSVDIPTDSDSLKIKLKATTEETAQAALAVLVQQVQDAHDPVAKSITSHTASILEQTVNSKVDTTLVDTQKQQTARTLELLTTLEEAQRELGSLKSPSSATPGGAKNAVIFAVLGAALGVFLSVCVIWVMHITSDKVYSTRTLTNRTGIKIIGSVMDSKNNLLLKKCEGRNMADSDIQLETLAVDIRCRAEDVKQLLVIGTADTEKLTQALRKEMAGVQICAGNILNSTSALEALKSCDAVVLVARCGVSRYSTVLRQMDVISDYEKQLLGCVLIGG